METKRIVECLRRCEKITGRADCVGCDYLYLGGLDCYHVLKKDAIERLEELDAELEKRTINDRPYEWISVEDRLPEEKQNVLAYDINDVGIIYIAFYFDGLWRQDDIPHVGVDTITHWMPLPSPPKPKEPTFKYVFLEKFPKAIIFNPAVTIDCCAIFPWLLDEEYCCQMDMTCEECWNQPYFEPQEEGEADA